MKQIEIRTGRGCNTHRLHQKEIKMVVFLVGTLEGDSDDPDPSCKGTQQVDVQSICSLEYMCRHSTAVRYHLANLLLMGANQVRLTMNSEVENYRMTPLTVKFVNANDNFAIEGYALAA